MAVRATLPATASAWSHLRLEIILMDGHSWSVWMVRPRVRDIISNRIGQIVVMWELAGRSLARPTICVCASSDGPNKAARTGRSQVESPASPQVTPNRDPMFCVCREAREGGVHVRAKPNSGLCHAAHSARRRAGARPGCSWTTSSLASDPAKFALSALRSAMRWGAPDRAPPAAGRAEAY